MSTKHKIRNGFRVVGPNTADYREHTWYFPSLEEARRFADNIAADLDAEYDIFQYIGTVRQVPRPTRPIEFVASGSPTDATKETSVQDGNAAGAALLTPDSPAS